MDKVELGAKIREVKQSFTLEFLCLTYVSHRFIFYFKRFYAGFMLILI